MTTHVPRMIDMDKFQNGDAGMHGAVFLAGPRHRRSSRRSPATAAPNAAPTACPTRSRVSVTSYQFTSGLSTFFSLPPVTMPPFTTSMPMQSAGCDEAGNCLP